MTGFLVRRVAQAVAVLFIVTAALMLLEHAFPGGPVRALVGTRATPQQVACYNGLWWLIYPPGLAIIVTCLSFNFIGDALRDAFETRLQRR